MEEMIMSNRRTLDEQIEAVRAEVEKKEKRLKELLQANNEKTDKARTHRLCERGSKVEKVLPDLIRLSEEQFETFVKKALLSGYAAKIIRELLPPEPANVPDSAARDGGNAAPKPANATHSNDVNSNAKPAEVTHNNDVNSGGRPAEATHNGGAVGNAKSAETARATG
jgi:hypothetical protein